LTSACADEGWLAGVSLAPMRRGDVPQVVAIERLSFPTAWTAESYLRELRNPSSYYVVARQGQELVGYAGMWILSGEAHISTLAVHPSFRRRGLGRLLLRHLLAAARERGAARATLEVRESNHAAQALYESCGFQAAGRLHKYYADTGEHGVLMCRPLAAGEGEGGDE